MKEKKKPDLIETERGTQIAHMEKRMKRGSFGGAEEESTMNSFTQKTIKKSSTQERKKSGGTPLILLQREKGETGDGAYHEED